ncbi:MAG TPA: YceI family protein [Acidimicrobiales bacterium]|jgi:polyisoprenoid-binding protein YceI
MTSPDQTVTDLPALAGTWTLDAARTSVVFLTKAMWVLNVRGTFKALEGSGTVGADGSVSGTLVIDAASVDTKQKKRDTHLRTADFFEVDAHPTITFAVTSSYPKGAGKVELAGDLTIRGTTRPVTVLADVDVTGSSATVSAELDVDRSAWGLTWGKLGAALTNHLEITARFTKV